MRTPLASPAPSARSGVSCGGLVGCLAAASLGVVPAVPAPPARGGQVLHLAHYFSGTHGLVAAAARARGWRAHEVDILLNGTDLGDAAEAARQLALIEHGEFGAAAPLVDVYTCCNANKITPKNYMQGKARGAASPPPSDGYGLESPVGQ